MSEFVDIPMTGDELLMLMAISKQVRDLSRGVATGKQTVAGVVASKAGIKPFASMRALIALEDLRRPRRETLDAIARGVGRPELGAAWWDAWRSVPHPDRTRP